MTPDTGILTQLLQDFQNVFTLGLSNIQGDANWLLAAFILLDVIIVLLFNANNPDLLKVLLEKILFYGFFIYVVLNYRYLLNVIIKSFAIIGAKAGGYNISMEMLSDPSALAEQGIYVSQPIWNHVTSYHGWDALFNLGDIIINIIMALLIMASFAIIGLQVFVTYLEFYIVGCLALILIPFAANKHTAFLGEKAIGAVFAFGIKLMVLSFIASAAVPLVAKWQLPKDPELQMMMYTLLGSATIAFLAWEAPKVAAGLLAGSPSISGASAVGSFAAGMGVAGAAGVTARNTVQGIARNIGSVAQAAQAGAHAAGGFRGAMAGVGRLVMARSSFGQGRQDTNRAMKAHAAAMKSAGMKDRLAS
ncbi:MAG: type IV secretion system protein [Bacteroidota bacterium]